jgi:hypothetical protein
MINKNKTPSRFSKIKKAVAQIKANQRKDRKFEKTLQRDFESQSQRVSNLLKH